MTIIGVPEKDRSDASSPVPRRSGRKQRQEPASIPPLIVPRRSAVDVDRIERAAATLSPLERRVLVMSARRGLRPDQIAARLELTERSAERILARALQKFDRILHDQPAGDGDRPGIGHFPLASAMRIGGNPLSVLLERILRVRSGSARCRVE